MVVVRGAPLGAHEGVDGVPLAVVGHDGTHDTVGPHHTQLLDAGEVIADVIRAEEDGRILGPTVSLLEIAAIVSKHEERAARRDGVCGAAHHGTPLLAGEMDVDENDQVERASRRRVAAEIGLDPVDLDPARLRQTSCFLQADAGEVDSGGAPPPFRQPDRVATFAGAEVECSPGREIRDLLDQRRFASALQTSSASA